MNQIKEIERSASTVKYSEKEDDFTVLPNHTFIVDKNRYLSYSKTAKWTDYQNDFDGNLDVTPKIGSRYAAFCGFSSYHINYHEDRRFRFKYCEKTDEPAITQPKQTLVTPRFNYDASAKVDCPADSVVTRISSDHHNYHQDRSWQFTCSKFKGLKTNSCGSWTDWKNTWDQGFNFECEDGKVITGINSSHDNYHEDRRFQFECCLWEYEGCRVIDDIPATHATPAIFRYNQGLLNPYGKHYPGGTVGTFTCPYNPMQAYLDSTTCQSSGSWDKDPSKECSNIHIKSAGYSVGKYASIQIDGETIIDPGGRGLNVVVSSDAGSVISSQTFDTHASSVHSANFVSLISNLKDGTWVFIAVRDEASNNLTASAKNVIKQLGSNKIDSLGLRHSWCIIGRKGAAAGTVVEDHNPNGVASCTEMLPSHFKETGFRLLPSSFNECPSSMFLSKDDCARAAVAVGGILQGGKVKEGSWSWVPFGCSINVSPVNGGHILYNSYHGTNNGIYQPVCSKGEFTLLPKSYKGGCPSSKDINKEECAAAALSAGGGLRNGNMLEGSWGNVPFGCSIETGASNGDNAVHYGTNKNGVNDGRFSSICHRLPVSHIYFSCLAFARNLFEC